jgi:hypothetical protein
VLIGSGLAVTGCGGSSPEAGSSSSPTTVRSTLTASAVSGPEFCGALKAAQPELDKVGNTDAAFAQLTLALVALYQTKNAVASMDAATMDALAASCPADAAKALKSTGKSTVGTAGTRTTPRPCTRRCCAGATRTNTCG